MKDWPVGAACFFAVVAFSGTLRADPQDRLDSERFGAGTLMGALEELERYRPPQAVPLVLPLLGHPDPDVARTAAWLLRRMERGAEGAQAAGSVLADILASPEARVSAAVALSELKHEGGMTVLRTVLSSDLIEEVRAAAAEALGELHRPGSGGALAQALGQDQSAKVRRAAAAALGNVPDATVEMLQGALSDEDSQVRVEAAWALGRHRFPDALGDLVRVLQTDADCRVQGAAAWALFWIGDPSVKDALEAASQGSCRLTAQAAAWALSGFSR